MAYCPPSQRRPAHRPTARCTYGSTGTFCVHDCPKCTTRMAERAAENRARRIRDTDRLIRQAPRTR